MTFASPGSPLVQLLERRTAELGSKVRLAAHLEISRPTLDKYLKGGRPDDDDVLRDRLAQRLGVKRVEFDRLCGDPPAPNNVIRLPSTSSGSEETSYFDEQTLAELRAEFMRSYIIGLKTPGMGDSAVWTSNAERGGRALGLSEFGDA